MTKKIDNLKNEIIKSLNKKLLNRLLISLTIVGGVTGFSLWGIKCRVEQVAINRISKQFEEPKIQELLKDVAGTKAKDIIENRLTPAIQEATTAVNQKIDSFEADLQQFKNTYDTELKKLAKEVEYIKNRNDILKLSDLSIATGDAEPFEKLETIYNSTPDEDIKMSALAGIFLVKTHFATMTRMKGTTVKYTEPNTGKEFTEDKIPTEALLQGLKNTETWQYRARVVELIKNRKEKTVPDVLLSTIKNDKKLEIRKKAMDSFESITGYTSQDIFNYECAAEWWQQNKAQVESKLKELQTIEMELK